VIIGICHFTGVTAGLAVASMTLGLITVQRRTIVRNTQLELFCVWDGDETNRCNFSTCTF